MTVDPVQDPETEELSSSPRSPRQRVSPFTGILVAILIVLLGVLIFRGIRSRISAEASLKTETEKNAALFVETVHPTLSSPTQEIVLPGSIQAYTDSPIYARTSGYLKKWNYDIGAQVKKGDLLAEIESPEVDKQLAQVHADLQSAKASLELAESSAKRWQDLLKLDSVSKQETDEKIADLSVKKAAYNSIASNVHRLEDLQSFEKVYAPFDGVITARNTDLGVLINAGANATGGELFRLAAIDRLRVFINVPQAFSQVSRPGTAVTLTLQERPGRTFSGKLVRTSSSLDAASRTLLTEIEVNNPRRELLPGSYASVHFPLPQQIKTLTIPVNTLLFRSEGPQLAVLRDGKAVLASITIGRDFGNEMEVLGGVEQGDAVILDPPDSIVSGTQVRLNGAGGQ